LVSYKRIYVCLPCLLYLLLHFPYLSFYYYLLLITIQLVVISGS